MTEVAGSSKRLLDEKQPLKPTVIDGDKHKLSASAMPESTTLWTLSH
jgi:hypothetical protein